MPYIATISNQDIRIDTGDNTPQRDVTIDGKTYSIDWRAVAALAADAKGQLSAGGRFSLLINNQSYEIYARRVLKPDEDGYQTYEVQLGEQRFEVQIEDEREKTLAGAVVHDTGEAKVRAPMPGLVIGLPLEVGSSVTKGQTVVVLEAMKMENDLAAPKSGKLKEVKVNKGQTVNQGDILVVIGAE